MFNMPLLICTSKNLLLILYFRSQIHQFLKALLNSLSHCGSCTDCSQTDWNFHQKTTE